MLGMLVNDVGGAIMDVIGRCSRMVDLRLAELCSEVSSNQDRYLPRISEGVAELGGEGSLLMLLSELLNDPSFSQHENFNEFTNFLEELVSVRGQQ